MRRALAAGFACGLIAVACGGDDASPDRIDEPTTIATTTPEVAGSTTTDASTSVPDPTEPPDAPTTAPATTLLSTPGWAPTRFSPRPTAGREIVGGPASDGTAVLAQLAGDGERVVSWTVVADEFRAEGSATTSGIIPIILRDIVAAEGTAYAVATEVDFDLVPIGWRLWTSADRATWTPASPSGLELATDLRTISATTHGLFLGGVRSDIPEAPGLWRSSDGLSWQLVGTPNHPDAGAVVDVIDTDAGLLAFVSGRGAVWTSADGSSWTPVDIAVAGVDGWSIESAARLGPVVVAVGGARVAETVQLLVLTSRDGGTSWAQVAVEPTTTMTDGRDPRVVAAAGALWVAAWHSGPGNVSLDAAACYRDLHSCRSHGVLLRSQDGVEWADLDLSFASSGRSPVPGVIDAGALGVLVMDRMAGPDGPGWTWSALELPPMRQPVPDLAAIEHYPLVRYSDTVDIGATYRYPMHLHCGIGVLGEFDGRTWIYADSAVGLPPSAGIDDLPADWPIAETDESLLGLITRIDADTIEYRLPTGDLVATYTASDQQVPGCA